MRPIATIDAEADPFAYGRTVRPFVWGVYFDGAFKSFKTFKPALEWLQSFNKKMVIYAHNGGRFDFLFPEVIAEIPNGQPLKIIHGRLAQFRIGDLEFRDSLSAVPIGLGKYKKDDIAYWKMEKKHRAKHMPEILKYLEMDCRYLHELISAFRENFGASLTLAGASLKAAMKLEDFESPKSTPAYFRDLKPFYYGGRVQSFSKGKVKGPIRLWDINSAYPFAMLQDHPWGASYHYSEYKGGPVPNRSCVELNAESLGAFPFGTAKFGTSFPDDKERRDFKVTGWEYNQAKALNLLGRKPQIAGIYSFHDSRNFKKYVNHFYNIRKTAPQGSADSIFGKLFMNSLYGRMGLDGSQYEQYQIAPPASAIALEKEGWQLREEAADGRWIYCRPEPKDKWRFHDVAVSISVTGFVRAMILKNLAAARKAGSVAHYVDTDGIQTSGPWEPEQGNELGQWKLEAVATEAHYAGKKLYTLKMKDGTWKKAHKGVVLNADQIVKITAGEEILYRKEAPSMGILSGTRFIQRRVRAT